MNHLLIGNGINIQFGGSDYLNSEIIKRALDNVNNNRYPEEIYPKETVDWLLVLYGIFADVLSGKYDQYAFGTDEEQSLINLKDRYNHRTIKAIENIGFEDFFLVHDLFCHKNKIDNPERFDFRECLRMLFLDSIYDSGKILEIYQNFPQKLKGYFASFNSIFTTNYDNNIETFTKRKVYYLHGAFHILSEVYDAASFRNLISDRPISNVKILDNYKHLYSNALTSFSGEMKLFAMNNPRNANSAIAKFSEAMIKKPEIAKQIESWKDSPNDLVRRLYETIILKKNDPKLSFKEDFPVREFVGITGKLHVLGLSINNDYHIFDGIQRNSELNEITYYSFNETEADKFKKILSSKKVSLVNVSNFWNEISQ